MIWVAIGVAVVGWLLGLLLMVGPIVHLLLVLALVLLVVEVRRNRA
jgi:hypothetical protein